MFDLLIEILPHFDESLLGYLHRLAEANGLAGIILRKEAKLAPCPKYLAMIKGREVHSSWSSVHAEIIGRASQTTRLWNLRQPRYCPVCLAESLYWRARWDISLMTVCGQHKLRLLDHCWNCGKPLSWDRHNAGNCPRCMHPLSRGDAIKHLMTVEEMWFAQELEQRLISGSHTIYRPMEKIPLDRFHEIAFRLGACIIRQIHMMPRKVRLARSMDEAQPIAEIAGRLFYNWPKGFFTVIDEIRNVGVELNSARPAVIFGVFYQELLRYHGKELYFIGEAFDVYLKAHWPRVADHLLTHPRRLIQ